MPTLLSKTWLEAAYPTALYDRAGKVDEITIEDLRSFVEDFNAADPPEIVIITEGHPSLDQPVAVGRVKEFALTDEGRLVFSPEWNEGYTPKETFHSVVFSRDNVDKITGKTRRFWIPAVGITDLPVLRELRKGKVSDPGTLALSAGMCIAEDEFQPEENVNEIAKALGLAETATVAEILSALSTLRSLQTISLSVQSFRRNTLTALGENPDDHANLLDTDTIQFELSSGKDFFGPTVARLAEANRQPPQFRTPVQQITEDATSIALRVFKA